jgi:hypothetical protein
MMAAKLGDGAIVSPKSSPDWLLVADGFQDLATGRFVHAVPWLPDRVLGPNGTTTMSEVWVRDDLLIIHSGAEQPWPHPLHETACAIGDRVDDLGQRAAVAGTVLVGALVLAAAGVMLVDLLGVTGIVLVACGLGCAWRLRRAHRRLGRILNEDGA